MGAKRQGQKGGQATQQGHAAAECNSFPRGPLLAPVPQMLVFPPLLHQVALLPLLGQACLAPAVISPTPTQALVAALCSTTARNVHLRRPIWAASLCPHQMSSQCGEAEEKATILPMPLAGKWLGT